MVLLSIALFFLYTWGFGFTLSSFLKEAESFFERNLTRIGVGLCAVPLAGILFSILRVPVDWRIFLALSTAYPLYWLFKNYKNFKLNPRFKKSDLSLLIVIAVFLLAFYMYYKGAFIYPYLEDDDSWSHALGVKYVSEQKTFFNPAGKIHYLDPYPPLYDGIIGLLNQTSSSLMWSLKFFNALIISLSIIFFYLFIKEFTSDANIALFSTITLAMVPAYLSHFIWAHAFVPGFIFLSFLFLERLKHDKKWAYMASFAISAIILTTTTQVIKYLVLFLIYFAVKSVIERKFALEIFFTGILGFFISLLWWAPLAFRYGSIQGLLKSLGLSKNVFTIPFDYFSNPYIYAALIILLTGAISAFYLVKAKLKPNYAGSIGMAAAVLMLFAYMVVYSSFYEFGTADRIYDFNDFFIAKKQNLINNPVGIGIAAFILLFAALLFLIYGQFSSIMQKKGSVSKSQFNAVYSLCIISSIALVLSSVSFFLFRFKPGTLIREWDLANPNNYAYVYSFSFKTWGVYLFTGSLMLIAAVYVFLIFKDYIPKQKAWVPIALFWLAYTFGGLYNIPTHLFTFRIWMLFAFVLSIFVGYSVASISGSAKKLGIPKIAVLTILLILIFFTSGIQKYTVNTSIWPPGGFWVSNEELQGYLWFKDNIPAGTNVFTFSNNALIIGFDKFVCHWCKEVQEYQRSGFNQSAEENHSWLKKEQYTYIIIDGQAARRFGVNETNNKVQNLISSNKFNPVFATNGFLLFKVA